MTFKLRLPILLAALALPAFLAPRAEAASQILGIVASNGIPTPLTCEDGQCRGYFSSFCLERERPSPTDENEYRLAPGSAITILAKRADGSSFRLAGEGLATIHSQIGFSSVSISLPEARLKALGAVSAAIEIEPLTTVLPAPVAGDPNPLSAEEIAYATGTLRRLAERSFETTGEANDTARLATLVVNSMPAEEPKTATARQAVWDKAMALANGTPLDAAGVADATKMFRSCTVAVDSLSAFNLKLCMKMHQADLMATTNRQYWDSLGGS